MENWGIAPIRFKILYVVGAVLATVGVVGAFVLIYADVPDWQVALWCGLTIGAGVGGMSALSRGQFAGTEQS